MSESLLFAILGFLVACLLGTVFASFLWRRAVTVTTRKITEDENFAGLDEVANLKTELRAAQNSVASKDREIDQAATKAAELEASIADAKASGEGAAASLKQELQAAGVALEAAHAERDAAKAALTAKDEEIKAAEEHVAEAQDRVAELENAIRALVKETSLFDAKPQQETPLDAQTLETKTPTSPAPIASDNTNEDGNPSAAESTSSLQKPNPAAATELPAGDEDTVEPSLAISKSLEERIEALKQGEKTSA